MTVVVDAIFRLRRDTSTNWASANPVLKLGEPGWDTDENKIKLGDGTSAWGDLEFLESDLPATLALIAALTTTSFGRAMLELVDAAALRAAAGMSANGSSLVTAANYAAMKVLLNYAVGDLSGFASGVATFLGTPSSANLFAALTTKTGSGGNVVFSNSPTIAAPTFTGVVTFPGNQYVRYGPRNLMYGSPTTNYYFSGGTGGVAFNNQADTATIATISEDGNLWAKQAVRPGDNTYANRPSAPIAGMLFNFTDSNTATWGAVIAGGGSNYVLGRYDGANWKVVGV